MVRLLIIFGVILVFSVVMLYVTIHLYKKNNPKPRKMTNNEYDVYPQD